MNSGSGDEQGGLACCDSWGGKESDMTEGLNCTELKVIIDVYNPVTIYCFVGLFLACVLCLEKFI